MYIRNREDVDKFVENQKLQLGLSDTEAESLRRQNMQRLVTEEEYDQKLMSTMEDLGCDVDFKDQQVSATAAPKSERGKTMKTRAVRKHVQDPYLSASQTVHARPTKISKIRSLFYEFALPNEYIVEVGKKDAVPVLGGKFFKLGKQFLKFPAAVQTVYFTSDNANKNYQGIKIDGYACWRIDPEKPQVAATSLDFSDQENPMGNTNRILRTICTEAIRHIIANQTIEEALTKKDEIGRNLKAQLERIEREWGVRFDQVGIERVTILSESVFEDLQQKARDNLRLTAAESRMATDQEIEKKKSEHEEEMESLRCRTEKESRILKATTESQIHKVELDEQAKREAEERKAAEESKKAENEAAERAAIQNAERNKRQIARDAEIAALKLAEEQKFKITKSASEMEIKIDSAEKETKIVEVQTQSEMAKTEAVHKRESREAELAFERENRAVEDKKNLEQNRMAAELERETARFEHSLKHKTEAALAEHEIDLRRLERVRLEEEVKNLVSNNRVLGAFVEKLPEIAASQKIDRYTVVGGSGDSPLTHSLAQILSLLDEHGLRGFFKPDENKAQAVPENQIPETASEKGTS